MSVTPYVWPAAGEFRNRNEDLQVLESWWESSDREPINLYGRRRVGKSWLFRRLAHGKPAVILVAQDGASPLRAFRAFADSLEPVLGIRPQIADVEDLFRVLYRLGSSQKVLVIIDEFTYLLGSTHAARTRALSAVQAVMEEERDSSRIKLILAGSLVAEMERLQHPKSPLYGRLRALDVQPIPFSDAATFLEGSDACENLVRYAVAGGMPRYLSTFGAGNLRQTVVANVLDRRGGLFNEPATLLQNELRTPSTYFTILECLSSGARGVGDVAAESGMTSSELTPYLETLRMMRLAERVTPAGSGPGERKALWRSSDHFVRFWFRFVRPHQAELEAGADPVAYYQSEIAPNLSSHTAPVFETETRRWLRKSYADSVLSVGAWWGSALSVERRAKRRTTEEIDAVGLHRKRVIVACEAKWTNAKLSANVVTDLLEYKLPAMAQAGYDVSRTEIVLASRSGFTRSVHDLAQKNNRITLVLADEILHTP